MALILVIEDEENIREVMAEMVEQFNHQVRLAATAADAVEMVKEERPDAILLDIVLPDARGTVLLDRLRKLLPDVPIIMVTANADEEIARETLKHGAFDYIIKPFTIERLRTVLDAALAT
jgi:DNA-binding NtrC family response regulator